MVSYIQLLHLGKDYVLVLLFLLNLGSFWCFPFQDKVLSTAMKMLLKLYCYDIVLLEEHFFAAWVFHTQSRRFVISSYKSEKVFQNILFGTVSQIEIDLCHYSGVSFLYHFPHLMNDFVWFIYFFQLLPCTKRICLVSCRPKEKVSHTFRVVTVVSPFFFRCRSPWFHRVSLTGWDPTCSSEGYLCPHEASSTRRVVEGDGLATDFGNRGNLVIFFTLWKGGFVVSYPRMSHWYMFDTKHPKGGYRARFLKHQ